MNGPLPEPPEGVGDAARDFWFEVVDAYELDEHELAMLREIVRTVSVLEDLDRIAADEGLVLRWGDGVRTHPAVIEARQQRIALARLIAALRLPEDMAGARPQRRTGARGVYGIRGVS